MKKLMTFCLLLTIAFTSQAKDGKPTKEETMQYLKSTILDVWGGSYFETKLGYKYGTSNSLNEIQLDGCILNTKGDYEVINSGEKTVRIDWSEDKLDLSKVETFEFKKEKQEGSYVNLNENLYLYYDTKERKQKTIFGFYCRPEDAEKF